MPRFTARYLSRAAIIAAIYAAVTFLAAPISFSVFQVRISEALTLLPILTPAAVPGLFVGCLASNLAGYQTGLTTAWDILFGSMATLAAALLTRRLRGNIYLAALPPVIVNAVVIGPMLTVLYGLPLWMSLGSVAVGQLIACYGLGIPLMWAMKKLPASVFPRNNG